jgi:oligopeptide transport system substrate-binding protein
VAVEGNAVEATVTDRMACDHLPARRWLPRQLFAGCLLWLAAAAALAAAPGVLHRTSGAEPPSLDPTLGSGTMAAPMLSDMVEGLVARTPAIRPAPGVAERWDVSADGLTYTFRLREGLRWSDGTPLTADDFVYSYRRLLDPATAATTAGLFLMIENAREVTQKTKPPESLGVSAPDPRTVVFRLATPAPYFLQLLANTQAAPVPRHAIEKLGRDWTRAGSLVSNGPYVLAERVPQNYVRLTRNPNYWAAKEVKVPEVYWYPTQDMGAATRRFRAGELDTVLNVAPDDLDWIRANRPKALHTGPIHATYLLVFNVTRPPFDDRRLRRALSLAVDREALTDKVLQTGVRPTWTFVSPGVGGYPGLRVADAGRPLAERQAEARELLAAAGYGPDRPLSVPLLYDTNEENRKVMVALATMWQAVGVQASPTNVEFVAVLRAFRARDFAIARSSTFALYDDPYAFLQQYGGRAANNWAGWADAQFDAAVAEGNATLDERARFARLEAAERRLLDEQPVIPLYHYQGKVLVAERVRGWWDGAIGTPPSRWLRLAD